MSDDWFNPTIKTPDGDEIEFSETDAKPIHRREDLLRDLRGQGKTASQIAKELNVGRRTILQQLRRFNIELPEGQKVPDYHRTTRYVHDQGGITWHTNQWLDGKQEAVADGGHGLTAAIAWLHETHKCPDCGRPHPTEKGQHDCMRGHAREMADQLANENEVGL